MKHKNDYEILKSYDKDKLIDVVYFVYDEYKIIERRANFKSFTWFLVGLVTSPSIMIIIKYRHLLW